MLKNEDDGILLLEKFINFFRIVLSISINKEEINRGNEILLENLMSISNNEENSILRLEESRIIVEIAIFGPVDRESRSKVKIWMNLILVNKFNLFKNLDSRFLLTILRD